MNSKKKYSKEFKLDAINLVKEQGYTCAEAARSLGISSSMLSRWVRESLESEINAFRGHGKLSSEQLEIRRLQEENKRLKMEKEILKKGMAFFVKEIK